MRSPTASQPSPDARTLHLFIAAHSSRQGGAEFCLDTTLRHLDRSRWRISVLFPREGPIVESARAMGVSIIVRHHAWWMLTTVTGWHWARVPSRVVSLSRWMKANRVDLVYTNTAVIPEAALAARLAGIPHVWHVHEVMTDAHMRPRLLSVGLTMRLIAALSRRVVFESRGARALCEAWVSNAKARVVPNSLRSLAGANRLDSSEARKALGIGPDDFVVVWVGQFSRRKRPVHLIDVLALMAARPRTTLIFVGDGPEEDAMTAARERHGFSDGQCRIVPFLADITPIMAAADTLALTSDEESFGLVLIEASSFGLPVVATRAEGPSEIVLDGETGFLVEIDDAAAFAERLDRLAATPDLRKRLGAAGAARVAQEYSAAVNTTRLEQVLDEALA
jgi:glycosyltransferase involved in cell wall biosynthesis